MTKAETAKLLAYIAIAYPNGKVEPNEPTVNLWAQFTDDVPYAFAKLAVDAMIATSPYPPTIAALRESVAKSTTDARGEMSAGEAWSKVRKAISKYGSYRPEQAHDALGDALWTAIEHVGGWKYICTTEDEQSTLSAQFERRYKAAQEQAKYRQQVPQAVQDHLKALGAAQGLKMIGGGSGA